MDLKNNFVFNAAVKARALNTAKINQSLNEKLVQFSEKKNKKY